MKKLFVALLALALLCGCTAAPQNTEPAQVTFEDTVNWDGQYDVVVVGFGGAGAVSAITAAKAGAKVLIVEKAPEGHEGGNTRYCGQMYVYGNGNYENTMAYYKALSGNHEIPEALLEVYVKNITNMSDVVAETFDLNKEDFVDAVGFQGAGSYSPEYPELPGAESITLMSTHDTGISDGYLWGIMKQRVTENADNIDVWYESPAVGLIQDPGNGTIIGVEVERGGKTLNVRANNGVVMACGGFENNPEMIETYLGLTNTVASGTLYNTGDGVEMAMEVGAKMWHMHVYEGMGGLGSTTVKTASGRVEYYTSYMPPCNSGSAIMVGGDGSRFVNESVTTRHGHVQKGNEYVNPQYPSDMYLVLSNKNYQTAMAYGVAIPADYEYTYSGNTLEELAAASGMNAETLAATIKSFNAHATAGTTDEFGRAGVTMEAFPEEGPYYAVKMFPVMLNTQGGAMRNENAEVLGQDGNPIPHLYSAGEFGGICAHQYQGGGNIAEVIIFGRLAGENAAKAKEYTSTVFSAVESTPVYVPGYETDLKTADYSDIELGENEYLGVGTGGMGGDIAVKVKIVEGKIESIEIAADNETPDRIAKVVETLIPSIIENQSTEVDVVSSCTLSSNAVIEAVNNAIADSQK